MGSWEEMRDVVQRLIGAGVKLTVNTDGPYLLGTDMHREVQKSVEHGLLTEPQLEECLATAREATFLKRLP